MTEVIYYVADDGTRFEDEGKCRRYEILCQLRENEKDFSVFRSDGSPCDFANGDELVDPECVFYIKANTESAIRAIVDWFYYFGVYCPYEDRWTENSICDLYGYLIAEGHEGWTNINQMYNELSTALEKMG